MYNPAAHVALFARLNIYITLAARRLTLRAGLPTLLPDTNSERNKPQSRCAEYEAKPMHISYYKPFPNSG